MQKLFAFGLIFLEASPLAEANDFSRRCGFERERRDGGACACIPNP